MKPTMDLVEYFHDGKIDFGIIVFDGDIPKGKKLYFCYGKSMPRLIEEFMRTEYAYLLEPYLLSYGMSIEDFK